MTHRSPKPGIRFLSRFAVALCLYSLSVGAQDPRLEQADLVLLGTVITKGRGVNAETAATPSTAVVRIERIVKPATPGPLHGFIGKPVTVTLTDPAALAVGERGVFYTRLVSIGRGLNLAAIAQRNQDTQLAASLENQMAELSNAALRAQLDVATDVVVGRVRRIEDAGPDVAAAPGATVLSEHAPQWRNAVIEVTETLKGGASSGDELVVRFSASMDVLWFDAPKLTVGQEGVFAIGAARTITGDVNMAMEAPGQAGTVVKKEQVLPLTERDRVRRLLR